MSRWCARTVEKDQVDCEELLFVLEGLPANKNTRPHDFDQTINEETALGPGNIKLPFEGGQFPC